jgi:prolipoprotein diacylglyceryltransferase
MSFFALVGGPAIQVLAITQIWIGGMVFWGGLALLSPVWMLSKSGLPVYLDAQKTGNSN